LISLQCSFFKISLLLITTLVVPFISQATEHAEAFSISQPDIGTGEQNTPPIKLFELIGSQIYSGDLTPGTQSHAPIYFPPSGKTNWQSVPHQLR